MLQILASNCSCSLLGDIRQVLRFIIYMYIFYLSTMLESPITPRRFAKMNAMSSTWDEGLKPVISMPAILGGHLPDSGSSSCNSSSPSSPAHHQTSSDTITSPSPAPSPYKPRTQFSFPGKQFFTNN